MKLLARAAALLLALAAFASAQALTVRNAHAMAFDSSSGFVYLFGGADESAVYGDLWKLSGTDWELVTDEGPGPRTFPALAYDAGRGSLVLFGGNDALFGTEARPPAALSDTWEFKDGKWNRLETRVSPPPRAEAALVYDHSQSRLILFGGYRMEGGEVTKLGDTWEFRRGTWRKISANGPEPRNGAAAVYDPSLKGVVLFGGSPQTRSYGSGTGETWVLKGDRWRRLETAQPPNVFDSEMTYDPEASSVLRFGGWNGTARIGELWRWAESRWTRIDSRNGPAARNHSAMVYDPVNKRSVLFGGHDGSIVFGDLWFLAGGKWTLARDSKPKPRADNGH